VQLTKTERLLDSCWVLSSFRSVSAVWNGYSALVTHFKEAAIDTQTAANKCKKIHGLFQSFKAIEFMKDLGLVHDVLEKMTNLSLQLQSLLMF
jgi:hypothetical protein